MPEMGVGNRPCGDEAADSADMLDTIKAALSIEGAQAVIDAAIIAYAKVVGTPILTMSFNNILTMSFKHVEVVASIMDGALHQDSHECSSRNSYFRHNPARRIGIMTGRVSSRAS